MLGCFIDPETQHILYIVNMLLQCIQLVTVSTSGFIQQLVSGAAQIADATNKKAYFSRVDFHKQTFSQFAAKITEYAFRRIFRTNLDAFNKLCDVFSRHIGVSTCLYQYVLDNPTEGIGYSNILRGLLKSTGGYISGEVALAIFLRLIASGMIYDIAGYWGLYPTIIYRAFDRVLSWVNAILFGMMDISRYLSAASWPAWRIVPPRSGRGCANYPIQLGQLGTIWRMIPLRLICGDLR